MQAPASGQIASVVVQKARASREKWALAVVSHSTGSARVKQRLSNMEYRQLSLRRVRDSNAGLHSNRFNAPSGWSPGLAFNFSKRKIRSSAMVLYLDLHGYLYRTNHADRHARGDGPRRSVRQEWRQGNLPTLSRAMIGLGGVGEQSANSPIRRMKPLGIREMREAEGLILSSKGKFPYSPLESAPQ
jgi:hypothetical protein